MPQVKYPVVFFAAAFILLLTSVPALSQQQDKKGGQDSAKVEKVIKDWKEKPQKVAREMTKKYGTPQEITEQRLVWHNNGPWKRTELINEEIDHEFPMPHKDMLMQVISYEVPAEKFDELAEYDGSVIAERTRGELAARCDKEAANFLALNLAHEIVTGERSVEEAREAYGEQIVAFAKGESAPLMEELNFRPQRTAGDPDKTTLDKATVEEVKELMKEMEKREVGQL